MPLSFWSELSRRDVYEVGAAYVLTAWIIAQPIDLVNDPFGLPDWFDTSALILLIAGFPVTLLLAWIYELRRDGIRRTEPADGAGRAAPAKNPRLNYVLLGLFVGAVLGSGSAWLIGNDADQEWLTGEAIPQIEALIDNAEWEAVFALAESAEQRIPGDPTPAEVWERMSWPARFITEPAGAMVFRRPYDEVDAPWQAMGVTPIDGSRMPKGVSSFIVYEGDAFGGWCQAEARARIRPVPDPREPKFRESVGPLAALSSCARRSRSRLRNTC